MKELATSIMELYEIKWGMEDRLEDAKKELKVYEKYEYSKESIEWQRNKIQRIQNVLDKTIAAIQEMEEGK